MNLFRDTRALLAICLSLATPVGTWAGNDLVDVRAEHLLITAPERALDATRPLTAGGGVLGGILGYVVAEAIKENRAARQWEQERETLRPLAEAAEVKTLMDQFRSDVASAVAEKYGVDGRPPQMFDSEKSRQAAEVALAPKPVLSAMIFSTYAASRCGRLGVYLAYGSGYVKQTLDIKRKPVKVYVPEHDRSLAVVSDWCLPGGMLDGFGAPTRDNPITTEQILPYLRQASAEVLDALRRDPLQGVDDQRIGTHGLRFDSYLIVEYHVGRTLLASADRKLLRWVPDGALQETQCNNACGPLERAQAEERARRTEWESSTPETLP